MITNQEIERYIEHIISASLEAGAEIMKIYNQEDLGIQSKSDDSPLTKADLAANMVLCKMLQNIAPQIPILSEENENSSYEERRKWEYCWIVDPLDGTKEFIKRNGEFTTNVALVKNGIPVAGVIYAPAIDQLFWSIPGKGAFGKVDAKVRSLKVADYQKSDKNLKIVCSRSHLNEATQKIVDEYNSAELVPSGSSLKFMKIAQGQAHLYPRMAPTMEWDTCAAQAILEEAGGLILNADTGIPLTYNKENLLNPSFIAKGGMQN